MRTVIDPARAAREQRLRSLVAEIAEPVRRYLVRRTDSATADDVLGEVLLVLWRRLDDVPDDAIPWAIVVARNTLANAERSARRQWRLVNRIMAVDPPRETVEHHDVGDDAADALHAALATLRPADAELLKLWAWDDLTVPQIATVLGIAPNTASVRLTRAKSRLRGALENSAVSSTRSTGHITREGGSSHAR